MWNRRKKLCMQKERSLLPLALDKKKEAWLMLMFSISTSHPRITLEFESCERTWFNHLRNGYWMKKMEGENCLMSDQSLSKWFLLHYLMLQKVNLIFLNVMWSNSSFLAVSRGCYTYKRASCEPGKTFSSATFFFLSTNTGSWGKVANDSTLKWALKNYCFNSVFFLFSFSGSFLWMDYSLHLNRLLFSFHTYHSHLSSLKSHSCQTSLR